MTDKELKRLSRSELLEMLLSQSRKMDKMQAEIDELKEKLKSREILLENAGSIAEAALELNGLWETAQSAADQYVENVKRRSDAMLAETEEFVRDVAGQMTALIGENPEMEQILRTVVEKCRASQE